MVFRTKIMAEYGRINNTVHIVSLQNASRFFSGTLVKFCHIPVILFTRLAKFFQNLSDVCYVNLSSKEPSEVPHQPFVCPTTGIYPCRLELFLCNSNWTLKARSDCGEIWTVACKDLACHSKIVKKSGRI